MTVRYRLTANPGRDISAVFTTDALIPADRMDTYLQPSQGGFTCTGCAGFHFLQSFHNIVQFDDGGGGSFSYGFPIGTFQNFGTYHAKNLGSGPGTLEVIDLSPRPVVFCSNMDQSSGQWWPFLGATTFVQRFKAKAGGLPTELGICMGNNQDGYWVQLQLAVDDVQVLDRTCYGLVQRYSDGATVFDLTGLVPPVRAGSWVAVSITPGMTIGIEPIFSQDPDVPQGILPPRIPMAARFYMKGLSEPGGA